MKNFIFFVFSFLKSFCWVLSLNSALSSPSSSNMVLIIPIYDSGLDLDDQYSSWILRISYEYLSCNVKDSVYSVQMSCKMEIVLDINTDEHCYK